MSDPSPATNRTSLMDNKPIRVRLRSITWLQHSPHHSSHALAISHTTTLARALAAVLSPTERPLYCVLRPSGRGSPATRHTRCHVRSTLLSHGHLQQRFKRSRSLLPEWLLPGCHVRIRLPTLHA